jgi:ubiquinone/menaquinone biosynthesis C-methylase UbiE
VGSLKTESNKFAIPWHKLMLLEHSAGALLKLTNQSDTFEDARIRLFIMKATRMSKINQLDNQYQNDSNLALRQSYLSQNSKSDAPTYFQTLFNNLPTTGIENVLEIGCGNGRLWSDNLQAIPSSWKVTLLDFSQGMIDKCHEALGDLVTYCCSTFEEAELGNTPFQLILCYYVLYHVKDLSIALSKVNSLLDAHGEFHVITVGGAVDETLQRVVIDNLSDDAQKDFAAVRACARTFCVENAVELLNVHFDIVSGASSKSTTELYDSEQILLPLRSYSETLKSADFSKARKTLDDYLLEHQVWKDTRETIYIVCKKREACCTLV